MRWLTTCVPAPLLRAMLSPSRQLLLPNQMRSRAVSLRVKRTLATPLATRNERMTTRGEVVSTRTGRDSPRVPSQVPARTRAR